MTFDLGGNAPPVPTGCGRCGSSYVEREYTTPLCKRCRDTLACRPLPLWMNGLIVVVALAVGIGLLRFPAALKAGVEYERGQRAAKRGDYASAEKSFQLVVDRYPGFTEGLARLTLAEYHAGHLPAAFENMGRLEGRELGNKDLFGELDAMASEISERAEKGAAARGGRR